MCCLLGSDFEAILNHRELIPILAIVMGCTTGIIAIVCKGVEMSFVYRPKIVA